MEVLLGSKDCLQATSLTKQLSQCSDDQQSRKAPITIAHQGFCILCLDEAPDVIDRSLFCNNAITSDSCCLTCLKSYVLSLTTGAFKGAVPALHCPLCPPAKEKGDGKRCLLNYSFLESLVDHSDLQVCLADYNELASSVGTMQCSSCHCRKSIHVTSNESDVAVARQEFGANLPEVRTSIASYESGDSGVESLFDDVTTRLFPAVNNLSDRDAWDKIILNVLRLISNPERRINFQLRYLRNRPRVWSPCHNVEQCYKCKTRSYHEGKTCAQVCALYDNDVLSCPQCGVFLVKGDGCDHVQCVCGKYFSFNALKTAQRNSKWFSEKFPDQTAWMCARVLCQTDDNCVRDLAYYDNTTTKAAEAWSKEHTHLAEHALVRWWLTKYPICPVQCCLFVPPSSTVQGIKRARETYRKYFRIQVEACEKEIMISKRALLSTFYPLRGDKERLMSKHLLDTNQHSNTLTQDCFISSLTVDRIREEIVPELLAWYSGNPAQLLKSSMLSRCEQFLILFGHLPLRLYTDPSRGISVTFGAGNNVRPSRHYSVGEEVQVSPLGATYLPSRKGVILEVKNNGILFDVELKTAVTIVVRNVLLARINTGPSSKKFMLPTIGMSAEQAQMFKSFICFIEKYGSTVLSGESGQDDVGLIRDFIRVACGIDQFIPDDTYGEQGYLTYEGSAHLTWNQLFEVIRPHLN